MMSNDTLPLSLYKANAELQLQIARLLQEIGQHWLDSAQQNSTENIAVTNAEIESLLRSCNWQSLATLPSASFCRLFELRARDLQFTSQIALKNQAAFMSGLQQALENWQKSVVSAFGDAIASQALPEMVKQWMQTWPSAVGTIHNNADKSP